MKLFKIMKNINMHLKIKLILFSLILLGVSACTNNKYQAADAFLKSGNYPIAIEEFDKLINISKNGYEKTLSENGRSEAYFQLAEKSKKLNNLNLAIRLYYLANSDKADEELINCYMILIDEFKKKDDKSRILATYNYIINYIYASPRVPEFMYYRLDSNYSWYNDKLKTWDYYTEMYGKFPDSPYVLKAQTIIDEFLKEKIDLVVVDKTKNLDLDVIINNLIELSKYPSSYRDYIAKEIALIYIQIAENDIKSTDYISADLNFRKALEYDQNQKDYVNKRLKDVCDLFISYGNTLLSKRQIDQAIEFYNRSFAIIPDYSIAKQAIQRAEKKRSDMLKAEEIKQEALQLDRKKKYAEALELFKRAYQLDDTEEISKLIFETNNVIQIEKDPKSFALKVVNEYDNGIIVKRVAVLKADLLKKWGKELRESGWKAIGSATRMKMELRYDFITPEDNYFLSWQVNMKERTVIPLNKLTEKLIGK